MSKKELIDAIAASAKLTKADAGRVINAVNNFADTLIKEHRLTQTAAIKIIKQVLTARPKQVAVKTKKASRAKAGEVLAKSHSKLTKADAGRSTK
jgi:nucleoid DNA-binding protein